LFAPSAPPFGRREEETERMRFIVHQYELICDEMAAFNAGLRAALVDFRRPLTKR
jgi:hypothetical protein